jgi:hypothetical protein
MLRLLGACLRRRMVERSLDIVCTGIRCTPASRLPVAKGWRACKTDSSEEGPASHSIDDRLRYSRIRLLARAGRVLSLCKTRSRTKDRDVVRVSGWPVLCAVWATLCLECTGGSSRLLEHARVLSLEFVVHPENRVNDSGHNLLRVSAIVLAHSSMSFPPEVDGSLKTDTAVPSDGVSDIVPKKSKHSMSRTQKILFFAIGWLIVLMPFLFWWATWFGRPLSDQQLNEYLHDHNKPRHIQHALVQLGDRMSRADAAARRWYPDLVLLSTDPVEQVRNTDAWVMGQDTSGPGFHETLLKMLSDSSPLVRGNAALSLVRFGDATGRPQILALLQPAHITAPEAGRIVDSDRPGTAIHQNGLIAKFAPAGSSKIIELRSPIPGRARSIAQPGANLAAGAEIAVVDPATAQVWEALRALYLVGQMDDLPAVRAYERDLPDISNDVRRQAIETEKAIRARAGLN